MDRGRATVMSAAARQAKERHQKELQELHTQLSPMPFLVDMPSRHPVNDKQIGFFILSQRGRVLSRSEKKGCSRHPVIIHSSSRSGDPRIDLLSLKMNLLRIPLLPLIDIFRHIDFKEKFLISLLSKRARNILKVTSLPIHFSFELSGELHISLGPYTYYSVLKADEVLDCLVAGEVMRLSFSSVRVFLREDSPQKQLLLINHMLDTFKKQSICVILFDPTLPVSALEFMKMVNQRKLLINSFYYHIESDSSEYIPRILDECTEVTDYISMGAVFPDDFVYTPPRQFKVKQLSVSKKTNWLNLESFMSCRSISLHSNRTPQSLNTFFRNWLESDSPLEYFSCISGKDSDFAPMVDGLSNDGIKKRYTTEEWVDVKRRDGLEFVIARSQDTIRIWNKQTHLDLAVVHLFPRIDRLPLKMDLLRIPLLVLVDVFKYMEFREKFLISLLSKRARETLKMMPVNFSFELSDELSIRLGPWGEGDKVMDYLVAGEVMRLSLYPEGVILRENSPQKQLLLANHVLDTFKKPSISVIFSDPALPSTAFQFMKIVNQKKLSIKSFVYYITSESSEFIPRILDECTEVTDSIRINAIFPDDFEYSSTCSFKAKELRVHKKSNWLNLETFMNCRRIILQLGEAPSRTPYSWNTFFRNWLDSDSPLEYLSCNSIDGFEFPIMVYELDKEGWNKRCAGEEWIDVKRRDGSAFVISRSWDTVRIMTKQAHLQHLWKQGG
uniref:F-box domain-containing protein n=1 Tax=Caenorhabditis tropicalis TaxID=1561998 RepID=A0A1I7UEF1_9PELO